MRWRSSPPAATPPPRALADLANLIEYGASVRGSLSLVQLAKTHALLAGPRLRQPARRQEHRPRRVAPPHRAHLRGGGGRPQCRRSGRGHPRPRRGALSPSMLPAEIVRQVRRIQLTTGRQVADVLAGAYVSVFKGRGVEFDEVRPYVPGDDVRTIDWNVTARVGSPYVKRYVEERQLTVMLLVDMSASLDFGSAHRSKREASGGALRAARLLGHPQRRQSGPVALPPRRRRIHPAPQGPKACLAGGARSAGARARGRERRAAARAPAPHLGDAAPATSRRASGSWSGAAATTGAVRPTSLQRWSSAAACCRAAPFFS